ncbi:MAG: PTS sugar transporter subunit IIA [Pseudomonadota bacterium]
MWKDLVAKENVLKELTSKVAKASNTSPDLILDQLLKRENESSTFFNDGVAFPHIRIKNLRRPIVSLGIALNGIEDVATEIPVKLIFLIIAPEEDPNVQIRILGMVSRLARNKNFVDKMINCDSKEKAWIAILDMERGAS